MDGEPGGQGFGEDRAVHAGVVPGDDVEPVGGFDGLVAVGGDGDDPRGRPSPGTAPPGRVGGMRVASSINSTRPSRIAVHQRSVHELVAAAGDRGVVAEEVVDGGVAVAGDGEQVGEGGLDHGGLAGAGRPVQQRRHLLGAQPPQFLDVPALAEPARVVQRAVRVGYGRGPPAGAPPPLLLERVRGCGGWQGAGGVDAGLGDLEAVVRVAVVGGVPGGGHLLQRLEHRPGGRGADRPGDLADLEDLVGVVGQVQGDLAVEVAGPVRRWPQWWVCRRSPAAAGRSRVGRSVGPAGWCGHVVASIPRSGPRTRLRVRGRSGTAQRRRVRSSTCRPVRAGQVGDHTALVLKGYGDT